MSLLSKLRPELFWTSVISARHAMAGRRRAVKQVASTGSDYLPMRIRTPAASATM